ncbi:MAG: tetratricopeptide repeat protein [Rubrobacter sp.]|nr:tetratricopeptide repeat protein [Rubrobacter sp.]
MGLKINLFGRFRVWRGGNLVGDEEWDRRKTRSLLKLLLTRPGRVFSRDEIVEALWPDSSPASAERSLRVAVSLLRRVVEPGLDHGPGSRYVVSRRPGYMFDREADCEVDAWEFEELWENAEAARNAENLDEAIRMYRSALDLSKGEFLAEETYEDWAATAREEWRERRLAALLELSECLALRGRYTEAIESCERAMALDGYREDLRRRLILYHYCAGEQTLALQAYRRYARRLKEELGASPSPELTRLKERVEARDVPGVDGMRRYPKPRRPLKLPYSLSRTHFVGRDREYALLVERLREAGEGSGGAVAIEGEAGVGKTRLAEEFLGYARGKGVRVLSGRCYERELGPPLEPVLDALEGTVDVAGMLPEAPDREEKELGYLRTGESRDDARFHHALTREIIRTSRDGKQNALILFLDDIQWADAATLAFLSCLTRRVSGERVLLLFTYRLEQRPELAGWLDGLAERRMLDTLSLNRLSPEDIARLLDSMSSRGFGERALLADFLHRESEGNPFYAVEYLRWLIESGAVAVDSRRRICGLKEEALRERVLPSGVKSLIQARFNALGQEARELLELAAVTGRDFEPSLPVKAAVLDETRAAAVMESLLSSAFIVETGTTYYFSHDKLRQALYEDIGVLRRRELHLKIAKALEEDGGEPAELAHHYLHAEAWPLALENLVRAGERAEESYAWDAASENYARALAVVEKLPDSDERRFELLVARERFLEHMDRREERAETVDEMFALARRLGDLEKIAEVHIRRIGVFMSFAEPGGAAEAAREAVSIFRELGNRAGEARAYRELGYVRWMNWEYPGALEANLQAIWIHRELGNQLAEAADAGNIAHVYRSMGDHDSALRWNEEAIRIDREMGYRIGESFRLNSMALIQRERGDLEAALSLNLESLPILAELGAKNLSTTQHVNSGTLYLSLGSPKEALEHFRTAVRLSRETGYVRDEGYALMSVGVALEQTGDPAGAAGSYRRAAELLEKAYEESEFPKELSAKADALTLLGAALHRSLDEPEEALDAYEAAAGIYCGLGEAGRLRKLLMNLAGLLWQTGDPESSLRNYEEALKLAREQGEKAHEAAALACLSVVHQNLGGYKRSIRRGREALELLQELEDPQAEAYVLTSLAESHNELGHYPSALSCLKRSLRLRREIGDLEGEIGVLHDLSEVYERLGETTRARDSSEAARSKQKASEGACALHHVERSE